MKQIRLISKPGARKYMSRAEFCQLMYKNAVQKQYIISTSKGLVNGLDVLKDTRRLNEEAEKFWWN